MPKTKVTSKTIPVILHELDKWQGKISWDLFCKRVAKVLGEEKISRQTLLDYDVIKFAYQKRKEALKEDDGSDVPYNATVQMLTDENKMLKAKVARLEDKEKAYKEQFVRWLENIRLMPGVDIVKLAEQLDRPLPKVNRQ